MSAVAAWLLAAFVAFLLQSGYALWLAAMLIRERARRRQVAARLRVYELTYGEDE